MFVHRAYFGSNEHRLCLDYAHLTALPRRVWQRSDWQALSAAGNQLTTLDARIGTLRALKALDLSGNALQTLPDAFAELQQLEALVLSTNQLTHFPEVLCELPNLQFLQLKGNKITHLPESIGRLQRLCILDLSFNPLQTLPKRLAQLPHLTNLICLSNAFEAFPEVLLEMPQLQYPDNLDLHFRLRLPLSQLRLLFQLLRRLDRHRLGLETRRVLFKLLFDQPLSPSDRAAALPLLYFNTNKTLRQRLHAYLAEGAAPLQVNSQIYLLGQPQQLQLNWLEQQPAYTTEAAAATHIILGQKPTKTALKRLPVDRAFVSEHQVQQHWAPLQHRAWLHAEADKIKALLLSGQAANVTLALELMEGSTLVPKLAHELLLAYTLLPYEAKAVRQQMQQCLARALPQFERQHLPHPAFVFYKKQTTLAPDVASNPSAKQERALTKRIVRCTEGVAYWDGVTLAQLLFEQAAVGYDYLLQHLPTSALQDWLEQFVEGEVLRLTALVALQQLPLLEGARWAGIRRLDLKGCAFRRAPAWDKLQALPQLEEIDLRQNPIRHLPRTALKQLSAYRILLSK